MPAPVRVIWCETLKQWTRPIGPALGRAGLACCLLAGCQGVADLQPWARPESVAAHSATAIGTAGSAPTTLLPNPMLVPVGDREFFWNQLVDTVDDFFDITSEQRVHLLGNSATSGRIETRMQPAATVLEPWRWDSTPGFELWQATLQSMRRKLTVDVSPQGGQYLVQVTVEKFLEDVERPSQGTPGSSTPRHDSSLMRLGTTDDRSPRTLGWIAQGRDIALEQQILQDFTARLSDSPPQTNRFSR